MKHGDAPDQGMGMGRGRMGMMAGMGRMMGGMMGRGHMGMMGGRCPMCGRRMHAGMEEGPHRGKGPKRYADDEIKSAVEDELTEDAWLDASEIEVHVQEGIVTLTGAVEDRRAKRYAEDLADHVPGVRDVRNELNIDNH